MNIKIDSHPLFDPAGFVFQCSQAPTVDTFETLLSLDPSAIDRSPFDFHREESQYEQVKGAIRKLLRHGGYKPTGRGKPASEYLVKAVREQRLGSINPLVDTLNAVSLHSCLPISVVDLQRCQGELRVGIAEVGSEYVFNASGQTIKLDGLLCLFDETGPCANAVKDSERTKTSDATTKSLVIIWGTNQLPGHSEETESWFRELVSEFGVTDEVTFLEA